MYKVIIVDDEKQIIDGLCKMIKWPEIGFEVCATARNGMEAIPLIKQHRADLVVTDVRMPIMDGLKMLEYVRKNIRHDVEFIILSGFSDFQYAQKAMQYNVKSYILKPIDEAELYGTLIEIRDVLDEKELRKSQRIKSCIHDCIAGASSESSAMILAGEEQYGLRYIAVERRREAATLAACAEEPAGEDLAACIAEKVGNANMRFVQRHDGGRCHVVAGQSLMSGYEFDVMRMAGAIAEHLCGRKSMPADILIGKKVPGFGSLHESVQSITQCRNKLFYQHKASIVLYDDIRDEKYCKVYEDSGAVVRIITAFRKNEMDRVAKSIDGLTDHFRTMQVVPEIALIHLDSVMASIIQILSERRDDIGEVLECYGAYKRIQDRLDLAGLGSLAKQFCQYCNDFSQQRKEHVDVVAKVMRYVSDNYAEPLRIADIAERFFVNPAYLGQQFAKKQGCSLNHYINTVRMERAKELLANTNHRIYEIALETGYEDPNYFSSKFYEYTNLTPSDYRNQRSNA